MKLRKNEKKILKALSVYRTPVPQDALLFNDIQYESLEKLELRSLLIQTISGEYYLHDLIKENIFVQLSPNERKKYHLISAVFLGDSDDEISKRECIYHYLKGGEFEKAFDQIVENADELIQKGYCESLKMIIEEIPKNKIPKHHVGQILFNKGKIFTLLGDWDNAVRVFNHCIDEEKEDSKTKMKACCGIGYIMVERGEWDKAIEIYKECLGICDLNKDFVNLTRLSFFGFNLIFTFHLSFGFCFFPIYF